MTPPNPLPSTLPRGVKLVPMDNTYMRGAVRVAASVLVLGKSRWPFEPEKSYYRGTLFLADLPGAHPNYVKLFDEDGYPPEAIDWESVVDAENRYQELSMRRQAHIAACDVEL